MSKGPPLEVRVWGDFACFTRPEMKVERVSYDVMTPSAARGVLEAIFWKPEFEWRILEIWVLRPIRHFSIMRNEVSSKISGSMQACGSRYFADADRTQRHTLALRDVAYLIKADIALRPHCTDDEAKYREQFRRNVAKGRCHHTPYLGCREFAAFFGEALAPEKPQEELSGDLGLMLFDLDYAGDGSGRGTPRFFRAKLDRGILRVPQELYKKGGIPC